MVQNKRLLCWLFSSGGLGVEGNALDKLIQRALVRNLKRFNAKERDHLMRFAYLGLDQDDQSSGYQSSTRFLSEPFDRRLHVFLRDNLGLEVETTPPRCAFAGMDYHLDWLFASLWLATNNPHWDGTAASTAGTEMSWTRIRRSRPSRSA